MTIRRSLRRRSGIVLATALVACIAPAGGQASTHHGREHVATKHHRHSARASLTADDVGVVDITGRLAVQGLKVAGTGIVVSPGGDVMTNNHVIQGVSQIRVTVPGGRTYRARVIGTDPAEDIALLGISGTWNAAPATFGDSSTVAVGDPVKAIGNAGGAGGAPSVASGTVTGIDQSVTALDEGGLGAEELSGLIETDAAVQPGDSGGPLVNSAGKVIGVDAAASQSRGQHATDGYAIPIDIATAIVNRIEALAQLAAPQSPPPVTAPGP
jgi:S1-C subfamily serine protease